MLLKKNFFLLFCFWKKKEKKVKHWNFCNISN